jgi:hypothetical protein
LKTWSPTPDQVSFAETIQHCESEGMAGEFETWRKVHREKTGIHIPSQTWSIWKQDTRFEEWLSILFLNEQGQFERSMESQKLRSAIMRRAVLPSSPPEIAKLAAEISGLRKPGDVVVETSSIVQILQEGQGKPNRWKE